MTHKPFLSVSPSSRAIQLLEIIHSDIAGPMNPKSLGGAAYLHMFMDDFIRYKVCYLLKCKSEAFACFKEYKTLMEKQQGKVIKKLRTDKAWEYTSNQFCHLLRQDRIEMQRITSYMPQSNRVSERSNSTVIGTRGALLHTVNAPKFYLADAAMPAIYVQNQLPTRTIQPGFTPFDLWHGRKPTYEHLQK